MLWPLAPAFLHLSKFRWITVKGFCLYKYACETKKQCERVILCFSERSLEEIEGKYSDLRRELVTVKETLSQITLQKEVLEDDKASLTLALSKVRCAFCSR